MEKTKRIRLNDRTLDNDIKYKGFLSYRHLRIIGWLCLAAAQLSTIFALASLIDPSFGQSFQNIKTILSFVGALPVPLFLLANFSNILRKKNDYRSLFILYGGGALGMYLFANFLVFHFGYGFVNKFVSAYDLWDVSMLFGRLLPSLGTQGYTLNIFIDLLMCTLLFFFMNFKPSGVTSEKKMLGFRLLVILPIAYEIAGIVIKYMIGMGQLALPSFVFFLLPGKPPLVFLAFVMVVFILKIGELNYKKRHDGSEELYQEHLQTNAHSFKTSIIISIVFLVIAILDLLALITLVIHAFVVASAATQVEEEITLLATKEINTWVGCGFGGAACLFLIIPIVLLFSYTKEHKNPKLDKFVPIVGVGLIVCVYIEGIFQVLLFSIDTLIEKLAEFMSTYVGTGGGQ